MTAPIWITEKDLGVLSDKSYFEKQLVATSEVGSVSYSFLSGKLPSGIQLTHTGLLTGVPAVTDPTEGMVDYVSKFTVRATDIDSNVTDRTFTVLISAVEPPTILTDQYDLGAYYDGSYLDLQLVGVDANPAATLTWSFVRGRLPPGITLSKQGLLQGFFYQNITTQTINQLGWDLTSWDKYVYDFIGLQNNSDYEFTVDLSDGISFARKTYVIHVIARDLLTGDNTIDRVGTERVRLSETPLHLPFITTMPQILPEVKFDKARQDTRFAFKFEGIDFDNEEFYFEITSPDDRGFDQDGDSDTHDYGTGFDMDEFDSSDYPMPTYLGLDNETGWYTGRISQQIEHQKDYTFQIYARKRYSNTLRGHRNTFQLNVLGQINEEITWFTDSDLGTIENGSVSSLTISAKSNTNRELFYSLKPDSGSRTPQGIVLLSNGMLSGRASFTFFKLDNEQITFDNKTTNFDQSYRFTVVAATANRSAYSERTFTIKLNIVNKKPYENLYLRGFPTADQRALFRSIMNNESLFPTQLIYRPTDPWYGKANDLRFLFMSGINPSYLADYIEAMGRNHYTKTIMFGDVKTAYAVDENFNVAYEVVYLDVIDDLLGIDPVTGDPAYGALTIDLTDRANLYKDGTTDTEYTELTPNGLGQMKSRITNSVGVSNKDALPLWMTCIQPDVDNPGQFIPPTGYLPAIVLAYTVPGAGRLIAYRLKNANFTFNKIPFTTDRYQLDSYLTTNYDIALAKFISGEESTFDQVSSVAERFRYKTTHVDYAVTVPYEKIHGQTVAYNQLWDCMDGVQDFQDGDTLIFAQQENFQDDPISMFSNRTKTQQWGPRQNSTDDAGLLEHDRYMVNNGQKIPQSKWVYRSDGWAISMPYGVAELIPGYKEYILEGRENQRAGIYQINISGDDVTLTQIATTAPGDIVTIAQGTQYGGKQLYFEAYPRHGNVPRWWVFTADLRFDPTSNDKLIAEHKETTFDQRGTRFFSHRDQYAGPETDAKYIKFPKIGEFL